MRRALPLLVLLLFASADAGLAASKRADDGPTVTDRDRRPEAQRSADIGIWGVPEPAYVTEALADPANQLTRDPVPWLPPEGKAGGTLRLHFGTSPKGFNPLSEPGADTTEIHEFVSTYLIKRHKTDPSQWRPELAYSMVTLDDGLTWTFQLREDFYWHEPVVAHSTGRYDWLKGDHPVTAPDVAFMLRMCLDEAVAGCAPLRSYFEDLDSYRAVDDYTFEIKFTRRRYSQQDVALPSLMPIPEFLYAYDEDGQRVTDKLVGHRFADHWYTLALGCGPYRMTAHRPGVEIILERDPRHPLGGNAFDRVVYRVLTGDQRLPLTELLAGRLDLAYIHPGTWRGDVLTAGPDSPLKDGSLVQGEWWEHAWFYIGWNLRKPMFADRQTRQALSYAFDGERFLRETFMGLGALTTGPLPTFLPHYDDTVPGYPHDLDRAAALLDEVGWTDTDGDGWRDRDLDGDGLREPFRFELTVYGSSDEYRLMAAVYQKDLARIGVEMVVRPTAWADLLEVVFDRSFDAVTLAWIGGPDISGFKQIWHSDQVDVEQSSNHVGFRNPEADAIIDELEVTFDHERRVELGHLFHRVLHEEAPYTFFYTRMRPAFWRPELRNVRFSMVRPYRNHRAWFFDAGGG